MKANDAARAAAGSGLRLDDLETLDIAGEGMSRLENMIKVVDSNMKK